VDDSRRSCPSPDGGHRRRIPRAHETDGFHGKPGLLAAEVESTVGAGQQAARNPQPDQLSMQEKDLELTATPGPRGVDVNNRRHRLGLYRRQAFRLYGFTARPFGLASALPIAWAK